VRAPDVQFAARARAPRMLGIALLLVGVLAAAASAWQYTAAARELERVEAQIGAARGSAERRRTPPTAVAPPIAVQKIDAINDAIARLNIPWNALFGVFEADAAMDVALLALQPEARKRTLVVRAEAANPRAMIAFVERLRAAPAFEDAVLVKHERREQDAGQPYRFSVEVRWRALP
jgi:hypothetical protein